jgi:ZIP family zinc transporter
MTSANEANLGLAIGLSVASGLCTSIGGLAVFVDSITKQSQSRILSSALALSAGVMLYVSFVEIFFKARLAIEVEYEPGVALGITSVCFFAGMAVTGLLELLVHRIMDSAGAAHSHEPVERPPDLASREAAFSNAEESSHRHAHGHSHRHTHATAPVRVSEVRIVTQPHSAAAGEDEEAGETEPEEINKAELRRTAMLTAVAIALHNFPEGLATFIATLAEPSLGIALAVAIAVHNVPEGMAVAMPVYYASGSKWKGFWWATLSGISEPIGGCIGARKVPAAAPVLVRTRTPSPARTCAPTHTLPGPHPPSTLHPLLPGWLILRDVLNDTGFGVVFAMVGGMMIFIVIHEMVPIAVRYEQE